MEGWPAVIESLDIANLGVIASAHVDFGGGLIVVTGETGAGKTMVLSSLQLLLGARADAALVRSGADRLSVDGIFSVGDDVASRVEEAGGVVEGGRAHRWPLRPRCRQVARAPGVAARSRLRVVRDCRVDGYDPRAVGSDSPDR